MARKIKTSTHLTKDHSVSNNEICGNCKHNYFLGFMGYSKCDLENNQVIGEWVLCPEWCPLKFAAKMVYE